MNLPTSTVRRLAFIKYLYRLGIQQSETPEPLSAAALLNFHDAAELFLQLACEHLNIGTKKPDFMDYWGLFKPPLGVELSQAEAMRRLNKARVALKHHGILPSKLDIESFRATATSFFEENTPLVFEVAFGAISMTDFVQPDKARENLKDAERLLDEGKLSEALGQTAIAFKQMLEDYEVRKLDRRFRSPFFFGERLHFHYDLPKGVDRTEFTTDDWRRERNERDLATFVGDLQESLEAMQEAIKILSMGIDYRRYTKFRILAPAVFMNQQGNYILHNGEYEHEQGLTIEDVRFCIEFAVETAVKLREFDYSLSASGL